MSKDEEKVTEEIEHLNRKEKKAVKELEHQVAKLTEQLETATKAADEWKNKYYSVFADMENARKQNDKDRINFIKYRAMGFIEKLLPILDGFHFATMHTPEDEVMKNFVLGFTNIYKQLIDALASEGVKEIAPKIGQAFDANTMYAIDTEYDAQQEPNMISKVFTNGYMLHDRMVRAATVITTTNKEPETSEEKAPENKDLN